MDARELVARAGLLLVDFDWRPTAMATVWLGGTSSSPFQALILQLQPFIRQFQPFIRQLLMIRPDAMPS